jgi:hypothetical protein
MRPPYAHLESDNVFGGSSREADTQSGRRAGGQAVFDQYWSLRAQEVRIPEPFQKATYRTVLLSIAEWMQGEALAPNWQGYTSYGP